MAPASAPGPRATSRPCGHPGPGPDGYIDRAAFTLAKLVAEAGEARQAEARELYARFVKDADPAGVDQSVRGLVVEMVKLSRWEIDALLVRGIGGPAPPLKGVDLEGRSMDLADFRGKVVLLSFWASWCGPCLRLVPRERTLLEHYKDRAFALVGVNGDPIEKLDRELLTTHQITWRSFQNERPTQKSICREWGMTAWPELYLIDHTGTSAAGSRPHGNELDRESSAGSHVAERQAARAATARWRNRSAEARQVPAKSTRSHDKQGRRVEVRAICLLRTSTPRLLPVVLFPARLWASRHRQQKATGDRTRPGDPQERDAVPVYRRLPPSPERLAGRQRRREAGAGHPVGGGAGVRDRPAACLFDRRVDGR